MSKDNNEINKIHIVDESGVAENIDILKKNKDRIEKLICSTDTFSLISSQIFKIMEENESILSGIENAKNAVDYYYYNISYSVDELKKYESSTDKYAYIADVKADMSASVDDKNKEVKILIKNLGFSGISKDDVISTKFFNRALNDEFISEFLVGKDIKAIGAIDSITLNLKYPTIPYEYTLLIIFKCADYEYARTEIKGINVIGGLDVDV